jgi:methyltransferase
MVISYSAYLTILAGLAVERIFELRLSARNARLAFAAGAVEVGHRNYAVMRVVHSLFFISAATEASLLNRAFPGGLGWASLVLAMMAQALRCWCVITLGPRWNTRIIVRPAIAPVTTGPYQFLRHPNYLAVIVEIACVPLIYGCWLTATVFSVGNAMLLAVRISAEEAAMGPAYQCAFNGRPRLLPSMARNSKVPRRKRLSFQ